MNPGEREELARLLSFQAEPWLPSDRHRILKEFVMTEIDQTQAEEAKKTAHPADTGVPERAGAGRHWWRRPAALVPALALAAAAAIAAPLALGGGAPAYAVSKNPDGTLSITINEIKDPKALEATLHGMGVNTVVDYIPMGKRCTPQPRSQNFLPKDEVRHPADGRPLVVWPPRDENARFQIDPAAIKPGQTGVLEFSVTGEGEGKIAGIWAGISNGPVAPCELVDSDEAPLGPPQGTTE